MDRITAADVIQAVGQMLARPRNPLPVDYAQL
jgi:hypothetical protein